MTLPDLSRLLSLPAKELRAIAQRLEALGLTPESAAPVVAAAQVVPPALRRPIRTFHLRRMAEPIGFALRALLFDDPVSEAEAAAAFGDVLGRMLETGLLHRTPRGIVSPYVLGVFNGLYLLSDNLVHGGDAVMGFGETTIELCRAAHPGRPIESALDLGCGSGTAALVLAGAARRVVGTDINPRAVALGRVNAALNGITNVEFREGDLFAPVAGERFDLVVSQPPFIPRPEGAGEAVFLYGGARGDELARRLLTEVEPHLAGAGRAVLLIEWAELAAEPLEARVRGALGSDALDLLLIQTPRVTPDEHAASYAAGLHPVLDQSFDDEALRRREHLARLGIEALRPTVTVLERPEKKPGKTWVVEAGPLARIALTAARIDKLFAARALADSSERLLAARLRVPAGTVFAEEQEGPGSEVESAIWARFADEALASPTRMTADLLFLITFVHESPDVRSALVQFAEAHEVPVQQAIQKALPSVRQALLSGMLEVE